MASVRLAEFVLGAAGLALIRRWVVSDSSASRERLADLKRLVEALGEGPLALELDVPKFEVTPGYDQWSQMYDSVPNPLIEVEQPTVRSLIDDLAVGTALDAACGTGRHAAYLREKGYRVVGIDGSPEMLARAKRRVSDADLRLGSLFALPIDDASVDLAVCALALDHVPNLEGVFAEFARVVRGNGRIIVSDFHPLAVALWGQALFPRPDGSYGLVQSYLHPVSEYFSAARAAGLTVERCEEPTWEPAQVELMVGPLFGLAPEMFREAFVGLPGALVWRFVRP